LLTLLILLARLALQLARARSSLLLLDLRAPTMDQNYDAAKIPESSCNRLQF
jgi:hypothetical protein